MPNLSIANEYTGFPRGMDTYPEVWQVKRIAAKRHEIGNVYKPTLVRFEDGELLCAPFRLRMLTEQNYNYIPPKWEEHLVFLSSKDDGQTWQEVSRLPGREARMQILRDNSLIMTCDLGENDINNDTGMYLMGVRRSYDRGQTWETEWLCIEDLQPQAKFLTTSRNILEMPDGSILLGVSSYWPGDPSFPCRDWFFRSQDGGRTWSEKIPVKVNYDSPGNKKFFSETDMHRFASGRIIGVTRFSAVYPKKGTSAPCGQEGGTHLRIFTMDEKTLEWTEESEFLDYHNVHPHLLELSDGRVLCSYGVRRFPFGAQAVISSDEGRGWSVDSPYILSWFSWGNLCGYPGSVEMPDGSILTAYTTRRFPGNQENLGDELFSELVRWKP